jgi:hypothetical protein
MNTYNKSEIMSRAWRILRNFPNLSWSACLTRSWAIAKDNQQKDISPIVMNKILNGLRVFNRSRTLTENKPMMAGTQEHFKMLNCKTGRKIMKSTETESKQMLESGELFAHDIMHQRRKESAHLTAG